MRAREKPAWASSSIAFAERIPCPAVDHEFAARVQFGEVSRQFAERDQARARNPAQLELLRLAHVEDHEFLAARRGGA